MSISTITVGGQQVTLVAIPTSPGLRSWEPKVHDSVALDRSPFTGQTQAQQWFGADELTATLNLPGLTLKQEADWVCFIMQCRGMANAFQVGDPMRPTIAGSGSSLFRAMVDNTVAGGNAAGSQTLGTQGWTANAQGVLLRGDWIQVGYRMYRVLDDVNADASGKALIAIWPSLREQPTSNGSTAPWLNATASVGFTVSGSIGNNTAAALFGGFALLPGVTLPPDAVVQGIYPVLIASATKDVAVQYAGWGTGMDMSTVVEGTNFTSPSAATGTFASTEFYGTSVGTSLAALSGQQIRILLNSSANVDSVSDLFTATAVGYAIYYTSATPHTDPLIAPPFAVPSGQGLAWALPTSVQQNGAFGTGSTGFIRPCTGFAYGVLPIDNGALILNGAKGLFRLATNDRPWSADMTRITRLSFPIQEYR